MAATAILRSHDCLQSHFLSNDSFSIPSSQIRSRKYSNPNPKNNVTNQNRRRKRSPVATVPEKQHDRKQYTDHTAKPAKLVMGQVKILKRGEKLSPEIVHDVGLVVPEEDLKVKVKAMDSDLDLDLKNPDLLLGSTDRFGPDPITMQKQIRVSDSKDGIYAGSAFFTSPPPSSVPVPGFLAKNGIGIAGIATTDLRRLLRLDLE